MTHPAVAEARRLHAEGKTKGAFDYLLTAMYRQGYTHELRDELERLFPTTPDVLQAIADYDQQLASNDLKVRHKTARSLGRLCLGSSGKTLKFVRHARARALLIKHLASRDPVVQENMAIALAGTFHHYVLDDDAFEPLRPVLKSGTDNARAWACEALARLSDRAIDDVLPLINDPAERVWKSAFDALTYGLDGGGTLERQPWGQAARRKVCAAMLRTDRDREVGFREYVVSLVMRTAEAKDLPALQQWQEADRSKSVKKLLQQAIDRAESLSPPAKAAKVSSKKRKQ